MVSAGCIVSAACLTWANRLELAGSLQSALRWETALQGPLMEGHLASDDQNVYVLLNRTLAAYSAKTGDRLWTREVRGPAAAPSTAV